MADLRFEGCCYEGYQYVTDNVAWDATGATTALTTTYHFSGDAVVPDGCYTIVSAFTTGFTATTFSTYDGVYTIQSDCSATLCATGNCCSNEICVNISFDTYSGLNGNYVVAGNYNNYPFWTG